MRPTSERRPMICTFVIGTSMRLCLLFQNDRDEVGDQRFALNGVLTQDLGCLGLACGADGRCVSLRVGEQCGPATTTGLYPFGSSLAEQAFSLQTRRVERGFGRVT